MKDENKNTNGLDNFFQSKLNPDHISDSVWNSPPDDIKESVMEELYDNKERRRFLPWLLLFSTLLIISFIVYQLQLANDKMESLQQQLSEVQEMNKITQQPSDDEKQLTDKETVINSQEGINGESVDLINTKPASTQTSLSFEKKSTTDNKKRDGSSFVSQKSIAHFKNEQKIAIANSEKSSSIVANSDPSQESKATVEYKIHSIAQIPQKGLELIETKDLVMPDLSYTTPVSVQTPIKTSNVFLSFLAGINGQKYTMSTGELNSARYKGYENFKLGSQANIYLQRRISPKWSLEGIVGLARFNNNSVFESIIDLADASIFVDAGNEYNLSAKANINSTLTESEMTMQNKFQQDPTGFFPAPISVSIDQQVTTGVLGLGLVYDLFDSPKWTSSLHLGANYRLLLNVSEERNMTLMLDNNPYYKSYTASDYSGPNSSWQSYFSGSIAYKLSNKFHLVSRLGYEFGLSKINDHQNDDIKTKWQIFNAQMGARYNF